MGAPILKDAPRGDTSPQPASDIFVAEITGVGTMPPTGSEQVVAYAWKEKMLKSRGRGYVDNPNGRTGTVTTEPAFGLNGASYAVGQLVFMRLRGWSAISGLRGSVFEIISAAQAALVVCMSSQPWPYAPTTSPINYQYFPGKVLNLSGSNLTGTYAPECWLVTYSTNHDAQAGRNYGSRGANLARSLLETKTYLGIPVGIASDDKTIYAVNYDATVELVYAVGGAGEGGTITDPEFGSSNSLIVPQNGGLIPGAIADAASGFLLRSHFDTRFPAVNGYAQDCWIYTAGHGTIANSGFTAELGSPAPSPRKDCWYWGYRVNSVLTQVGENGPEIYLPVYVIIPGVGVSGDAAGGEDLFCPNVAKIDFHALDFILSGWFENFETGEMEPSGTVIVQTRGLTGSFPCTGVWRFQDGLLQEISDDGSGNPAGGTQPGAPGGGLPGVGGVGGGVMPPDAPLAAPPPILIIPQNWPNGGLGGGIVGRLPWVIDQGGIGAAPPPPVMLWIQ